MRKQSLWVVGALVALGFGAYLLSADVSWAEKQKIGPFDPTNVGAPGDSLNDELADRPGADRTNDRRPDGTADQVNDGTPDCIGNFAGDDSGNCNLGNGTGVIGDVTPEDTESDSTPDAAPDAARYATINRAGDDATDYDRDWVESDTYRANAGLSLSVGDLAPDGFSVGSTVRIFDGNRDAVGRDGNHDGTDAATDRVGEDRGGRDQTPDGVGDRTGADGVTSRVNQDGTRDSSANAGDGTPDWTEDKGQLRDRSYWRNNPSKDVSYAFGPHDKNPDDADDEGGLSVAVAGGGGGGGGCSLVASQSADQASGLAYLLVLLAPVALVVVRRRLRRS
jgi:hypothetical protein